MGLSKIRAEIPEYSDDALDADGAHLKSYEVFVQVERGKSQTHVGSVDAVDDEMALLFAREHFGRDQPCVQVWVCPREAITKTQSDGDLLFRLSDQSYRFAKGYEVGRKWREFRAQRDYDEYRREDLKEFVDPG